MPNEPAFHVSYERSPYLRVYEGQVKLRCGRRSMRPPLQRVSQAHGEC